jgi:hypothetical protein
MKKILYCFAVCILLFTSACEKDWLERKSKTLILEEQVWNDPKMILGLLANYYNRLTMDQSIETNWRNMANYDDAMWSGQNNEEGRNNMVNYSYSSWTLWNYDLIRDINLALESIEKYGVNLTAAQRKQYSAELRFIRAFNYFELVKRMGGVPLITKQLIYDYSGNATNLRVPRSKEYEVYDFIASEMDAIKGDIGNVNSGIPSATRANKYTCFALKCRAMLYAASLAKYNNLMPVPITTTGGEVGIPASMATGYYTSALAAADSILLSGKFSLYKKNANLGENFYEVTYKKTNNAEVMLAKDYLTAKDKRHWFAYDNIARSIREDNLASSSMTPSLNLVESFDNLDGSPGTLVNRNAGNTDYIYYDNLYDIFANKDARLYGTVIYPGTSFKGLYVEIQAGVKVWNPVTSTYSNIESADIGTKHTDGKLLTGGSGPHRTMQEVSNTGFYFRKFIDAGAGTSTRGIRSDNWWVWFRLGEVYMNATEAALELGNTPRALTLINTLRERAGFPPNSLATLTMAKVMQERRNELAFEDHRLWDLIRWRTAHTTWDGVASNPNTKVYALYPYRVINASDPTKDGKYVFDKMVAPRFITPRFFRTGNYYSQISQTVLNNNPLIIKNPEH